MIVKTIHIHSALECKDSRWRATIASSNHPLLDDWVGPERETRAAAQKDLEDEINQIDKRIRLSDIALVLAVPSEPQLAEKEIELQANEQLAATIGIKRAARCGHWYAFAEPSEEPGVWDGHLEPWEGPHRDTHEQAEADAYLFAQKLAEPTTIGGQPGRIQPLYTVN